MWALYAWLLVGGFIGGIVQLIMADYRNEILVKDAFYYVEHFYKTYSDKINCIGLIIAILFILAFTLPGSVLIVLIFAFCWILSALWELFKFIFKKR